MKTNKTYNVKIITRFQRYETMIERYKEEKEGVDSKNENMSLLLK